MVLQWEADTQYNLGDVVVFEGIKYQIVQPHRSQSDWTPPVTPALWSRVREEYGGDCQPQPPCENPDEKRWDDHKAPQEVDIPVEEREKHWYDIDDERKRQLEIGGGLAAGAALLAGGFAWYKHREHKSEEEAKAAAWTVQNWMQEAQVRTEAFHRNGPQGPATWVLVHGKEIPRGALQAGEENGNVFFACRTFHEGGIQVGKASVYLQEGASIGYGDEEINVNTYEILIADERAVHWEVSHGRIDLEKLGARPVEAGREADGAPLYVAQAHHEGAVQPGKCGPKIDGASIAWGGKEHLKNDYRVLCYN